MTIRMSLICAAGAGLIVMGCASPQASGQGPLEYDASGTMECSALTPSFHSQCEWRALRPNFGAAELWITNPDGETGPTYRVLYFINNSFTTQDGAVVEAARNGDYWTISIPGREYYRFRDEVLVGEEIP